jgi:subfamily B ATP-binding cassette protein MsbA
MKELVRLRRFAPRFALLAAIAVASILVTSGLRGAILYQVGSVVKPALGESDEEAQGPKTEPGRAAVGSSFAPLRSARQAVESAKQRWKDLFGVDQAKTDESQRRRLVLASAIVLLVLGAGMSLADMVSVFVTHFIAFSMLRGVRQRLFEHLQHMPLAFFENRHSGDLLSRITNDTTALQAVFASPIATMLQGPPTAAVALITMLGLSWRLSMAAFVLLPLVSVVSVWIGAKLRKQHRNVQERMADLMAFSEETFGGMRIIQAFGLESLVDELFGRVNRAVFRTSVRTARLRALNVPVAGLVLIVGATVALAVGGNEIIAGRVGGSDLITFLFAMVLLGTNVAKVTKLNLLVQQAAAPCARIWEIIDTESTLTDAPDAVELTDVQGRITFRDVRFAYAPDSAPVLTDINLEIPPGEVVAIAGPSGAGKSTLANLVPRLYDVSSGAILVDGHDVRSVTRASLRHSLGIVPQETVLFATTIRENIAYGRPDATLEQITVAAEAAQAHEFISTLPQGYDTDIGEGGVKLSGGQRQRIAIARALLRDPRILILDEATSSLDAESESAVQAAIGKLLEGRTALIIAHRLSTIRNADRILVLDRGRIVEQGTHDELMAAGGLYRTLYETQLREETRAEKTEAAEA